MLRDFPKDAVLKTSSMELNNEDLPLVETDSSISRCGCLSFCYFPIFDVFMNQFTLQIKNCYIYLKARQMNTKIHKPGLESGFSLSFSLMVAHRETEFLQKDISGTRKPLLLLDNSKQEKGVCPPCLGEILLV